MSVRLTPEVTEHVRRVAALYNPLAEPLLVGSLFWLGAGHDADVVVLVADACNPPAGAAPCAEKGYAFTEFVAYRHGYVNVLATDSPKVYAGWQRAHRDMPKLPLVLLKYKGARVAACEKLRKEGEDECQFD